MMFKQSVAMGMSHYHLLLYKSSRSGQISESNTLLVNIDLPVPDATAYP